MEWNDEYLYVQEVDETDTMSSHEELLRRGAISGEEDAFIRGFLTS